MIDIIHATWCASVVKGRHHYLMLQQQNVIQPNLCFLGMILHFALVQQSKWLLAQYACAGWIICYQKRVVNTGGGAPFYKSGRRVSTLLSEFCTVQVLLDGTGESLYFTEHRGFRISRGFIVHKHIYSVCPHIIDGHFSGVFVGQGSTVDVTN